MGWGYLGIQLHLESYHESIPGFAVSTFAIIPKPCLKFDNRSVRNYKANSLSDTVHPKQIRAVYGLKVFFLYSFAVPSSSPTIQPIVKGVYYCIENKRNVTVTWEVIKVLQHQSALLQEIDSTSFP